MANFLLNLVGLLTHTRKSDLLRQIAYLKAENRILRAKLPKQIEVTPAERTRLHNGCRAFNARQMRRASTDEDRALFRVSKPLGHLPNGQSLGQLGKRVRQPPIDLSRTRKRCGHAQPHAILVEQ